MKWRGKMERKINRPTKHKKLKIHGMILEYFPCSLGYGGK